MKKKQPKGIADIEYVRSTVVSWRTSGSHEFPLQNYINSVLDKVHQNIPKKNILCTIAFC
jgi:hypothetical protein